MVVDYVSVFQTLLVTLRASTTRFYSVFSGELPFERYHTLLQHNVIKDEPELEESLKEVTIGPEEEEDDDDDYEEEDESEEDAARPMEDKPKRTVGRKKGVNFYRSDTVNSNSFIGKVFLQNSWNLN